MTPIDSDTGTETPIGHTLAGVLLRRWYAVLIPLLLLPATAYYLSSRQDATYEAATKVLVARPQISAALLDAPIPSQDPIRRAETERELAGMRDVAALAVERLGLPTTSVASVAEMISVQTDRLTDILSLTARTPSRRQSVRFANAAAAAYVTLRRRLETDGIERAKARAQALLDKARPGSALAAEEQQRLDRLATLEDLAGNSVVIVERAVTAEKVAPTPARTAQLGAGLGLLLGIALAYLMEALDRRARGSAQIGRALGLPILGEIPGIRRLRGRGRVPAPVRDAPFTEASEAFRFLETNVALSPVGGRCRTVLVTSAGRREGKTTVAFNVALSAADAGKRVLLLELDFRHPRVADTLEVAVSGGVAEILRGTASLDDVDMLLPVAPQPGTRAGASGLTVVCAGTRISNPMQYLRSAAIQTLVQQAAERFDLVVIDAPPLFGQGDAMVAASLADGVLLVVDARVARRSRLLRLRDVTEQLPAPLIGVAVNRAGSRSPTPPQEHGRKPAEPGRVIRAA